MVGANSCPLLYLLQFCGSPSTQPFCFPITLQLFGPTTPYLVPFCTLYYLRLLFLVWVALRRAAHLHTRCCCVAVVTAGRWFCRGALDAVNHSVRLSSWTGHSPALFSSVPPRAANALHHGPLPTLTTRAHTAVRRIRCPTAIAACIYAHLCCMPCAATPHQRRALYSDLPYRTTSRVWVTLTVMDSDGGLRWLGQQIDNALFLFSEYPTFPVFS